MLGGDHLVVASDDGHEAVVKQQAPRAAEAIEAIVCPRASGPIYRLGPGQTIGQESQGEDSVVNQHAVKLLERLAVHRSVLEHPAANHRVERRIAEGDSKVGLQRTEGEPCVAVENGERVGRLEVTSLEPHLSAQCLADQGGIRRVSTSPVKDCPLAGEVGEVALENRHMASQRTGLGVLAQVRLVARRCGAYIPRELFPIEAVEERDELLCVGVRRNRSVPVSRHERRPTLDVAWASVRPLRRAPRFAGSTRAGDQL